jgi:hypothetical protein
MEGEIALEEMNEEEAGITEQWQKKIKCKCREKNY